MKISLPGSIKGVVTFIVALALMPALILMVYSGYSAARADIDELRQAALRSVKNIARQQTVLVENTRVLLLTLSKLAEIRNKDIEASSVLLQNLVLHAPVYADIRLCDTDGNTMASSSPDSAELSELAREQIRAAASGNSFAVQEMARHDNHTAPLINCLFPVRQDGQTIGVLLASIIVHVPPSELAKLEANPKEYLHIVDKRGHIVFAYPPTASLDDPKDHSRHCPWRDVVKSPLRSGLTQGGEGQDIAFEKLFLGEEKEPGLSVSLNISTSAVFDRMLARIITDVLLLLGATGFAFAVTWRLCNASLRAPMRRFLAAANRIKEGDLSTRIPKDFIARELNILADSLNSMTQSLETRDHELVAASDAATAASTAKSEFLANMSHEIRTPMNAILGMAYLAKNSELTERQRNYLDAIQQEAGKLLAVINDILDFSKIKAGKVHIETVSFALPKLLQEVTRTAEDEAKRKSVELSSFLAPDLPEFLAGDPLHLSQVLSAILTHAVKYAAQGRVSFRCIPDDGQEPTVTLSFTIAYAGGEEDNAEIAKSLSEEGGADDHAGPESGPRLSLAIARNLVHLMHGTLEVQTGPGTDVVVHIRLPFSSAGPEAAEATRAEDAAASGAGREWNAAPPPLAGNGSGPEGDANAPARAGDARPQTNLKNTRILLVEDNPINQQIAEEILTSAGASVHIAANGLEALALLDEMPRGAPYHMVLMDLQMPELDGFAATRRLRLDDRFKNLPVIAMTAHNLANEWQQCREVGMNDYVTKPIDVPVLLSVIGKWMRTPANGRAIHE